MRKQVTSASLVGAPPDRDWLDVGSAAVVEVTSEDGAHPVESAQLQGEKRGWRAACGVRRAAGPGPQTIRLALDKPQKLRRIWLKLEETEIKRTQEFVLRWSPDSGRSYREIVRQQCVSAHHHAAQRIIGDAYWQPGFLPDSLVQVFQ